MSEKSSRSSSTRKPKTSTASVSPPDGAAEARPEPKADAKPVRRRSPRATSEAKAKAGTNDSEVESGGEEVAEEGSESEESSGATEFEPAETEVVQDLPEEEEWSGEAAAGKATVPERARPERRASEEEDVPEANDGALSRYDPMQAYLREVQRHPLLTPDQEHDLATRYYTTGDVRAAHTLVTANLRLVVKIAYEYRRAYKNIMDLVQEGNVGLMQAVKKYDPSRGVKLSSYAAWWIRAYILRYILNNWRMVKLGTTQAQRKLFFNLNKEKQKLLAMGIDPSPAVIAERLNVDEKEVVDMDVRLGSSESSLDAPVGDSDGKSTARVDLMPSNVEAADVALAEAEINQMLRGKLNTFRETLKGKDREIFDLRLVAPDEPLTLQQLGDRFGVSRERVRQLEARLVGKLRQHLHAELDEAGS